MPFKLRIHADDAGVTERCTEQILREWVDGSIDGFSILANGASVQRIKETLDVERNRPHNICTHLNLTDGLPTLTATEVASLIDPNTGRFNLDVTQIMRLVLFSSARKKKQLLQEIENEWRAQVRFTKSAIAPHRLSGVDGHQHIHMIPPLFRIASKICVEEGLTYIRLSNEALPLFQLGRALRSLRMLPNLAKVVLLKTFAKIDFSIKEKHGLVSSDRVFGILDSGLLTLEPLQKAVNSGYFDGEKSLEIIAHIGSPDEGIIRSRTRSQEIIDFYLSPNRERERLEVRKGAPTFAAYREN